MKLLDVIDLGDRIDIKMLNEKQAEEMGGKPAVVYQSSVCD